MFHLIDRVSIRVSVRDRIRVTKNDRVSAIMNAIIRVANSVLIRIIIHARVLALMSCSYSCYY